MSEKSDDAFGRIALQRGYLTVAQLQECRHHQAQLSVSGQRKSLGEIALEKGYITKEQLEELGSQPQAKSVEKTIGKYQIISMLGKGGMGAVYKARHIELDKTVAIKVLPSQLARNRTYIERFQREARLAAKISHPNVVQVFDVGEEGGLHYLVMEFVDGETVADLLAREGRLDEKRTMRIILEVARALDEAYDHGIIHRDIKPANIMVTRKGIAKLGDLGIAKQLHGHQDVSLTSAGAAMGTPSYMAPEQARGARDVDHRADIYSLGATMFHMLTGEMPFKGSNPNEVIIKLATEPVPDPRSLVPEISRELAELTMRMMAKDPAQRPQHPREVAAALEAMLQALTMTPLTPPPETPRAGVSTMPEQMVPRRASETSPAILAPRRKSRGLLVGVVVALLLLAGGGAFIFVKLRAGKDKLQLYEKALQAAERLAKEGHYVEAIAKYEEAQSLVKFLDPVPSSAMEISAKIGEVVKKKIEKEKPVAPPGPSEELKRLIAEASKADQEAAVTIELQDQKQLLEKAAKLYAQAIEQSDKEREPTAKLQLAKGEVETRLVEVEKKIKEKRRKELKSKYDILIAEARKLAGERKWDAAIKEWQEAKKLGAEMEPAPENYAAIEEEIRKCTEAQESEARKAHRAQEYARKMAQAKESEAKGDLRAALAQYQEAANFAEDPKEANQKVAVITRQLGQQELLANFEQLYKAALAAKAQKNWEMALAKLSQAQEAVQAIEQKPAAYAQIPALIAEIQKIQKEESILAERARTFQARLREAEEAERRGLYAEAIRILTEAKNFTTSEEDTNALLQRLAAAEKSAQQIAAFQEALKQATELEQKEDWKGAVAALQKAQQLGSTIKPAPEGFPELAPRLTNIQIRLAYHESYTKAEAFQKAGDWKAAEAAWKDAFERGAALKPPPKDYAAIEQRLKQCRILANIPKDMVYVPPGEYPRGSKDGPEEEGPDHKVWLDGFYIDKYEVTNAQYREFVLATGHRPPMNDDRTYTLWGGAMKEPTYIDPAILNQPVVNVSWEDAVAYCNWRSRKEGLPEGTYRLPTEAEWEAAARGTDLRTYPWGNTPPTSKHANFGKKWEGKNTLAPVGSYEAGKSPFGCYDMAGNAEEWCSDWHQPDYYQFAPDKNPRGPETGLTRVIRGGSWQSNAKMLRCAARSRRDYPVQRSPTVGFRCVRSAPTQ